MSCDLYSQNHHMINSVQKVNWSESISRAAGTVGKPKIVSVPDVEHYRENIEFILQKGFLEAQYAFSFIYDIQVPRMLKR